MPNEEEIHADTAAANDSGTAEDVVVTSTTTQSSDPLDAITDPEELRKIAKSRGNAYKRVKGELDDVKTSLTPANPLSQPVTRADVLKQNEKKGIALASEADPDIKDNLDKLVPLMNTNYGGTIPEPEEIAERLKDALAVFRRRNPKQDDSNPGADLATDVGMQGRSQTANAKANVISVDPRFQEPKGPDSWYGKPKP